MMRFGPAAALAVALLLAGCNGKGDAANEDIKKQLDQILAATKDAGAQARAVADTSKTTAEQLRTLSGQTDALQKALTAGFAAQKRGALSLRLDQEAPCDNDPECTATARAICTRINYPNAITSHFTQGLRPTLQSLVCFD